MELKKYKLGELIDVKRGTSLAGEHYATSGDLIRLTCGNFDYNNNCFKENTSKDDIYYTAPVREEYIMNEGDIITPLTEQAIGLLGSTAIVPESGKYIQSQDVAKIICKENLIDHDFAFYLISSSIVKKQLSVAAQQTKIRHTSPDKIKDCVVWVPSLQEQKQIASVLSNLDRKIALNRATNRNLEAMAKQLYDYWFVQFDFPNEEGKPYKSSGGKMVWNESLKREIPEGWKVTRLDEMTSSVNGGEWGDDAYSDKSPIEIHCLRGADFKDTYEAPTRYISPKKQGKCLTEFDLVVEISGGSPTQATGRSVFITKELLDYYDDKLTCTNFCQSVSFGNKQIALYFNYIWNMFYENDIMFNFEGKTSGLKNLQIDVILKEQWYIPTDNLLENFHDKVLPMLQAMEENKTNHLQHKETHSFLSS